MFGYILPEKPELKIREYELFRAYYCGVCKSIGKRWGQIPRVTLNYDTTFLALLLSSIHDDRIHVKKERCITHPIHKRAVVKKNEIIDYASDINIILAYYNLEDNWRDEKSVVSVAGMSILRRSFRKLFDKYSEKCVIIKKMLEELFRLEKEKCSSMDQAAEPFAKLMETIMLYQKLPDFKKNESVLRWLGYNIGRWIYILDAFDDMEKDLRKKTYNPLLIQFQYENEDIGAFRCRIREKVEYNLMHTLSEIAKSYELLEVKNNRGILENIIYMGMLRKTEQILKVGSCKKVEKSV